MPARSRSKTVLIVEDDPDIREVLEEMIDAGGHAVVTATNGAEGLAALAQVDPPALVLLDLMMPVMDGWQFRQAQIRDAALADIPVIVVSAAGRDRLEKIHADAYLSKPVDLDELLGCVTQFCRP